MKGSDFVAVERLTNKAGEVLAAAGESCDRVPAESLGWLLRDGLIRPKEEPGPRRVKRAAEGRE